MMMKASPRNESVLTPPGRPHVFAERVNDEEGLAEYVVLADTAPEDLAPAWTPALVVERDVGSQPRSNYQVTCFLFLTEM